MARVRKYYDWEYDRIITEETARKQWERMKELGYTRQSFETYAAENFYDLSNRIENAAAQAVHDRCGTWEPVCSWRTLHKRSR